MTSNADVDASAAAAHWSIPFCHSTWGHFSGCSQLPSPVSSQGRPGIYLKFQISGVGPLRRAVPTHGRRIPIVAVSVLSYLLLVSGVRGIFLLYSWRSHLRTWLPRSPHPRRKSCSVLPGPCSQFASSFTSYFSEGVGFY